MNDDAAAYAAFRDACGRFRPGCSGNPAGRPPGSRSEASILKEQLRGDQIDAAVQIIGDKLAAGSEATARFVVKQIDPKKRAARITFDYPPGASVIERFQALFAAAARGEITPEEAQTLSRVLEREGNTRAKAAAAARDLERDIRADHKRAQAARAAADKATAAAERTAAEQAAVAAKVAAHWAAQEVWREERLATMAAEQAAREAAAAADAPRDPDPAAAAPDGDATLLKPCSITPPADADAPGADRAAAAPSVPAPPPATPPRAAQPAIPWGWPRSAKRAGMTKSQKAYWYGSVKQHRSLKRHGLSVWQQTPQQLADAQRFVRQDDDLSAGASAQADPPRPDGAARPPDRSGR